MRKIVRLGVVIPTKTDVGYCVANERSIQMRHCHDYYEYGWEYSGRRVEMTAKP